MNRLGLRLQRAQLKEIGQQVVGVFIDETNLVELARIAELPHARADGHPETAGNYDGMLPLDWVTLPEQDDADGRAAVLGCTCGEVGCWPLRVRIVETPQRVRWSDFQQPHRPNWSHEGLGPFVFDRTQYDDEVARIRAVVRRTDVR